MSKKLKTALKNLRQSISPEDANAQEKFFLLLNAAIPFLMGCYVFLNPLSMAAVKELCYYLSVLALMVLLVFRKTDFTLRSPLTATLGLFSLWAVLGLFTTLDVSNTLHDLRGYLLEYLLVLYLLINFYRSRDRLELLSTIVIVSATVFSVGGMILFYGIEGHPLQTRFGLTFKEMYTGFMCFTTIFAAVLGLRAMYEAKSTQGRLFFFLCFLILSAATMLNQARGATIALGAALIIMCAHRKQNLIFIAVAVAVTILLIAPLFHERMTATGMSTTQDIRSKMFRLSWEVIKDRPIAGLGYGGEIYGNRNLVDLEKYNAKLPESYRQSNPIIPSTHNAFLDVTVRTGIVGLVLFCMILLTALWMIWDVFRRRKEDFFRSWSICLTACFVSYMIQAFLNDALYGTQGVLLYIQLAMIGILWNLARKETADASNSGV